MHLNYQSHGEGHPLIVLHGLFGMLDNWHTVAKMLSTQFRVLLVDLRNHGRSPHSTEFNYRVMAEDIRDFIKQHSLDPVFLLGHSMGGKTAVQTALDYPELVDKLVVVDIALRAYSSLHDTILEALLSVDLTKCPTRQDVENALALKIPDPAVRQFLMKNLARAEDGSFRWKMNLPDLSAKYPEVLKRVDSGSRFTKPVLIVRSTKSNYVNTADISEFRSLFPQSTVVDFDTGHWIHAEAPERLTNVVTDFLRNPVH